LAMHRVDDDFDGFLGKFLCHLCAAGAQEPCGSRLRRIRIARGDDGIVKAGNRISHTFQNT
jgi:hypothetical protein